MRTGLKGHRRTVLGFSMAFLVAVTALPGTAIPAAAEEGSKDSAPANTTQRSCGLAVSTNSSAAVCPIAAVGREKPPIHFAAYSVEDVVARIREECGLSEPEARDFLRMRVQTSLLLTTSAMDQQLAISHIAWSNGRLIIEATDAAHRRISDTLAKRWIL